MQSAYRKHHSEMTLLRVMVLRSPPRSRISIRRFISGLWHNWPCDSGRKARALLRFLKTDTESGSDPTRRPSVHSALCVMKSHKGLYLERYSLPSICPYRMLLLAITWKLCFTQMSLNWIYLSILQLVSVSDCPPNLYRGCDAKDHAKCAKE